MNLYGKLVFSICAIFVSSLSWANAPQLNQQDIMIMIIAEAQRQNFPPELALAVAESESSFRPNSRSSAGALGVMQIMPATARDVYGMSSASLYDPQVNISTGIHFLKSLIDSYGRTDIALSHYNGGSRVRRSDGSLHILPATQGYVNKVLNRQQHYANHYLVNNAKTWQNRQFAQNRSVTRPLQGNTVANTMASTRRAAIVASLQDLQNHNDRRTLSPQTQHLQVAVQTVNSRRSARPTSWQAW